MNLLNIKNLTVKKDGTTIDCASFGRGNKTLVLLPGLSFQRVRGSALLLAYMYRIFSKEYTVYVIDKKEYIPDGYTIREMADDTAFAMERLGLCSADVFGVSQGGMIAQYLAVDYPQLVHKLVLGVTAARQNRTMEEVLGGWIQMAEQGRYEAIVEDMLRKMYSEKYVKKYGWLFPILSKIGKPKDFTRFIALARACFACDCYSEVDRITCPVFVIGGKEDKVVTGAASEEIAEKLRCELYMYYTLGHGAYDEAHDFNKHIYKFLCQENI